MQTLIKEVSKQEVVKAMRLYMIFKKLKQTSVNKRKNYCNILSETTCLPLLWCFNDFFSSNEDFNQAAEVLRIKNFDFC